ncbi:MAG: DUF6265 family protein [Acidobacteriota bacterium]
MHRRLSVHQVVWTVFSTLLILGAATPAGAESQNRETASASDIARLGWLAGCWQGESGEECWLPPDSGRMVGLNRAPGGGMYEFLRIEQEEDGRLVYHASPRGRCPATPFTATHVAERRIRFENPTHDFPQQLEYWLDESDNLHARVTATAEDGSEEGFVVTWQRSSWTSSSSR